MILFSLQQVAAGGSNHFAVVEPAEPFDAFGHKLFDEVDFCDYLGVLQATDDVDYDSLQVVRVNEEFLRRDPEVLPEKVDFFANLTSATIVDPFKLAHGRFKNGELLEVANGQRVWHTFVDVRYEVLCVRLVKHLRFFVFG